MRLQEHLLMFTIKFTNSKTIEKSRQLMVKTGVLHLAFYCMHYAFYKRYGIQKKIKEQIRSRTNRIRQFMRSYTDIGSQCIRDQHLLLLILSIKNGDIV